MNEPTNATDMQNILDRVVDVQNVTAHIVTNHENGALTCHFTRSVPGYRLSLEVPVIVDLLALPPGMLEQGILRALCNNARWALSDTILLDLARQDAIDAAIRDTTTKAIRGLHA